MMSVALTAEAKVLPPSSPESRLPLPLCVGFGIGSFGIAILLNVVTVLFPAMMTTVLGQSAAVAGLLLTFSKLYDIGADVAIGAASDRTRTRIGRRRPYLLFGAAVSGISFLMIFIPPKLTGTPLALWMGLALVVYSTGYSLFSVPYMAMAGEMTDGYHERTRLLSFRTFFISVGQLAASAGAAALIGWFGGGSLGYAVMGVVAGVLLSGTMMISFFGTRNARMMPATPKARISRRELVSTLTSNRPFVLLMAIKLSQYVAIAMISTTKVLFLLNVVKVGYAGLVNLTLIQNVVAVVAIPLWVALGRRIGKRPAYLLATAMLGVVYVSWFFTDVNITMTGILLRGAANGVAAAGTTLLSVAMLPDVMEYDRLRTGLRREGVFSSVYSIVEKLGYALGAGIIGVILSASGFLPSLQGKLVVQPHSAMLALYGGASLIPASLILLSWLLMLAYPLDDKMLRRTQLLQAR
ncbi:MFS transporter [Sphingomonas sp. AAP5]|nr:MFS transporter [Sphingomonas sp. AAP5]